jgi:hypothetical protein
MAEQYEDDAGSRLTAPGCLLTLFSTAVILVSAVPIVSWRDPASKLPLPRSVAIAVPLVVGAFCFGIGSAILKVLGLPVWAKPKKDPSDEAEEPKASFSSADPESQKIIAHFRQRFRDGPLGIWRYSLDERIGLGFEGTGLYGNTIEFRPDGTGVLASWGWQSEEQTAFHWKPSGPCEVVIDVVSNDTESSAKDEPDVVRFDFFVVDASRQVFLSQAGDPDKFWRATGPLVRVEIAKAPHGLHIR